MDVDVDAVLIEETNSAATAGMNLKRSTRGDINGYPIYISPREAAQQQQSRARGSFFWTRFFAVFSTLTQESK